MKKTILLLLLSVNFLFAQENNRADTKTLTLNGIVEFEQTIDAFPPKIFSKTIQVPGLIDLAEPKIDQYEKYFYGTQKPRYSWYKFVFSIDSTFANHFAILKILKSRFNTQIIINGHDCGTYMQCNTPVEADLTGFLNYKDKNVLLVRIGERAWLPKESATGFDREKFTDFPGIWDDIFIRFIGPLEINRTLVLPNIKTSKVKVKIKLENRAKFLERNMEYSELKYEAKIFIREKKTKKIVSDTVKLKGKLKCQKSKVVETELKITNPVLWSPKSPFLYQAVIIIKSKEIVFNDYGNPELKKPKLANYFLGDSDKRIVTFGMRGFNGQGKKFMLNGEVIKLFGSSFTLNRFFEDKNRSNLPWDKKWVKKLMVEIPKSLGWNAFRVSIGLLPSFWYDMADEYGFLIQNEYPMWNLRGSNEEVKKEYTDWVWTDGNHPSIIIWDALNEQTDKFVGKELLPSLRKLDPTRIWDAGWNDDKEMTKIEMKEIHWYTLAHGWWSTNEQVKKLRKKYRFGNLFSDVYGLEKYSKEKVPLILNEYGWLWLNRDGKHSAIRTEGSFTGNDITPYKNNYEYYEPDGTQLYSARDIYEYYLGKNANAAERRSFQAYLFAIETEVARASGVFAGVISFPYLTNDHGYTGDWFQEDIKKLRPTQTLLAHYHVMKPFAVFIDLEDGRYLKNPITYNAGSQLSFNLFAINDSKYFKNGTIEIKLLNSNNRILFNKKISLKLNRYSNKIIPITIALPKIEDGYMLLTELDDYADKNIKQVSRRYLRIGKEVYNFPDYFYKLPKDYPLK